MSVTDPANNPTGYLNEAAAATAAAHQQPQPGPAGVAS